MPRTNSLITTIRYLGETMLVKAAYNSLKLLPIAHASALGGYAASSIGPLLPRSNVARSNLQQAMPELDSSEITVIIKNMWDNIGRTFAEFPHLASMDDRAVQKLAVLEGIEYVQNATESGRGILFFTGHLANWEFLPRLASSYSYPLTVVYRKGNNPGLERLILNQRKHYFAGAIPKGKSGSRQIIQALQQGQRLGILVDQKMNDGIKVNFFGIPAMTAPAIARLALKYNCPILPTRIVRLDGVRHKVIVYPPIIATNTGDTEKDVHEIMCRINLMLEKWIREYPAQWIWLHNRWPDKSKL